jgi:5-methylcytosine-specific restriction endonuclease McrA
VAQIGPRREVVDFMRSLYGRPCMYCGGYGDTVDHLVPLSRGGEHHPFNLGPSCSTCNCRKGNKTAEEFSSC